MTLKICGLSEGRPAMEGKETRPILQVVPFNSSADEFAIEDSPIPITVNYRSDSRPSPATTTMSGLAPSRSSCC